MHAGKNAAYTHLLCVSSHAGVNVYTYMSCCHCVSRKLWERLSIFEIVDRASRKKIGLKLIYFNSLLLACLLTLVLKDKKKFSYGIIWQMRFHIWTSYGSMSVVLFRDFLLMVVYFLHAYKSKLEGKKLYEKKKEEKHLLLLINHKKEEKKVSIN